MGYINFEKHSRDLHIISFPISECVVSIAPVPPPPPHLFLNIFSCFLLLLSFIFFNNILLLLLFLFFSSSFSLILQIINIIYPNSFILFKNIFMYVQSCIFRPNAKKKEHYAMCNSSYYVFLLSVDSLPYFFVLKASGLIAALM
jgi:hypothetical protein